MSSLLNFYTLNRFCAPGTIIVASASQSPNCSLHHPSIHQPAYSTPFTLPPLRKCIPDPPVLHATLHRNPSPSCSPPPEDSLASFPLCPLIDANHLASYALRCEAAIPCSSGRTRNIGLPERSYWTTDDSKRFSRWCGHDTAQTLRVYGSTYCIAGLSSKVACRDGNWIKIKKADDDGHFWLRTWSKSVYGIVNLLT